MSCQYRNRPRRPSLQPPQQPRAQCQPHRSRPTTSAVDADLAALRQRAEARPSAPSLPLRCPPSARLARPGSVFALRVHELVVTVANQVGRPPADEVAAFMTPVGSGRHSPCGRGTDGGTRIRFVDVFARRRRRARSSLPSSSPRPPQVGLRTRQRHRSRAVMALPAHRNQPNARRPSLCAPTFPDRCVVTDGLT